MPDNSFEEIKLKKGDSISIKLKGLATAGYEWNYILNDDKDCIKISKDFAPYDGKDTGHHGASADEIFTITALKKGTTIIHFTQQRKWEKNTPTNERNVKITIEE